MYISWTGWEIFNNIAHAISSKSIRRGKLGTNDYDKRHSPIANNTSMIHGVHVAFNNIWFTFSGVRVLFSNYLPSSGWVRPILCRWIANLSCDVGYLKSCLTELFSRKETGGNGWGEVDIWMTIIELENCNWNGGISVKLVST